MAKQQTNSEVDVLIIGAGVIGLATAYQVSRLYPSRRILLVEKNRRYGQETSSRSSEVIHAGMYYPPGSLKARFCVQGNRLLYEFCSRQQVRHERLGKIIIAVEDEEAERLKSLYRQGLENGVDLDWLEGAAVQKLEPAIRAAAGIWSPHTGIIDSDGLMRSLYRLLCEQGVVCLFKTEVDDIVKDRDAYSVKLSRDLIETPVIINCAGLQSDRIAAMAGMQVDELGYRLHYCKGEYYRLSPAPGIKHLVYPLPERNGLGIHITRDMAGGQRLGPNAYYIDEIDYSMNEDYKPEFYKSVKRYLPALELAHLHPDYAGIRPKLQGGDGAFHDFVIKEESPVGFPGFINLIGIESPGLTSCLAIGQYVCSLLEA
ncbi:MAG: NAD(P)/FAD-dependent oxidoreductase [Syntrophomonas sp.]